MGEMTQEIDEVGYIPGDANRKNRNLAQGLYTSPVVSNKLYCPFIIT